MQHSLSFDVSPPDPAVEEAHVPPALRSIDPQIVESVQAFLVSATYGRYRQLFLHLDDTHLEEFIQAGVDEQFSRAREIKRKGRRSSRKGRAAK